MRYIIQKFKKLEKIEKGEASKVCLFFHSKRVMKISRGPFPLFYSPGENRLINQGFPWGCWGRGGEAVGRKGQRQWGAVQKPWWGEVGHLDLTKYQRKFQFFQYHQ